MPAVRQKLHLSICSNLRSRLSIAVAPLKASVRMCYFIFIHQINSLIHERTLPWRFILWLRGQVQRATIAIYRKSVHEALCR